MIVLIVLQALFATSIPMGKILVHMSSPFFLSGARMVLAGSFLLAYQYCVAPEAFTFNISHWRLYAVVIFISIYLKYILRYWGLQYLPSGKTSLLLQLTPFVVALFSYLLFHERITFKQWCGMCVAFGGLIPLLHAGSPTAINGSSAPFFLLAEFAIIGSLLAHSLGVLAMRQLMCAHGYSASMANGLRMFGGGLLALMTSFFCEGFGTVSNGPSFVFWLVALIMVSNIISHNVYASLLTQYSPTLLSLTDFLGPLFVTGYGCLFLGEVVTWHFFFAGIFVLSGLYLFYRDELSRSKTIPWQSNRAKVPQLQNEQ